MASSSRAAALRSAELGLYVFPVLVLRDGDKVVLVDSWAKESSTDPADIARMWEEARTEPNAYGIDCGKSGLVIVDLDVKNGEDGPGNWQRLTGGQAPATFQSRTRSAGTHLLYRDPQALYRNSQGKLAPGIDVRGVGGYAVGPGSEGYYWDGEAPLSLEDIPEAPRAFLEPKAEPLVDDPFVSAQSPKSPAYALSTMAGALHDISMSKTGTRNATLNSAAFAVGKCVPGLLDENEARERLIQAGLDAGLESGETHKTVEQGLTAGMADPWPVEQARRPATVTEPEIRNAPLDWLSFLEEEPGEPDWLPGGLVERGSQNALVGEGKVGKSLFMFELASAMSTGRPYLADEEERKPARVLYVDQENSLQDLRRRADALGLGPDDLSNLVYLPFPSFGPLNTAKGAEALLAEVSRYGAEVVILDTISRMIEGNENDSQPWLDLYRYLHVRLKADGIGSWRLDHFGKDHERGARGNSAKTQDVDSVWELRAGGGPGKLLLKRTHTRTGLGPDLLQLIRKGRPGEHGTTTHVTATDVLDLMSAGGVAEVVALLDRHGFPKEWGREKCLTEARKQGLKIKLANDLWKFVLETRRNRP